MPESPTKASPPSSLVPVGSSACPREADFPRGERPGAPAAFTPQSAAATPAEPRRPQGGNKSVSAAPRVPQRRTPPPGPSPSFFPGSAEVSESGRDASPGNFTNLPGVTGQWRQRRGFPVISVLATRYHRKRAGGSAAQLGAAAVGGSASIPCPSSPALARPSTRTYTPGLPATAPPAAAALTSSSFLLLARDTFCICKASRDRPRTLLPGGRCGVAPAFSGTCAGTRVVGAFAFRLRPGACPLYFAWGWGVPTTF
ncbi:uncharacterized protein [Manis javanica]|uniref:uncharacterized protein n=1 Tax=Manis javanica TaxID=9974 RepID=UPI003C6CC951